LERAVGHLATVCVKTVSKYLPKYLRPKWRRFYSQEGEDIVINIFFGWEFKGIYVDIGAHDPSLWSNTKLLYDIGWRGLNIDPMPGLTERFRKHRPRDICIEAAIDIGSDTPLHYWIFPDEPRWNCLAPAEPVNERDGQMFRPSRQIDVPVLTISEALAQANLERVDLLNLDIEGGEEYILRHWPWDRYVPKVICVEIIGKPAAEVAQSALTRFLAERGLVFASQLVCSVIYIERNFLATRYPRPNVVEGRPASPLGWSEAARHEQESLVTERH
jgi:FkbM family methyltransferase